MMARRLLANPPSATSTLVSRVLEEGLERSSTEQRAGGTSAGPARARPRRQPEQARQFPSTVATLSPAWSPRPSSALAARPTPRLEFGEGEPDLAADHGGMAGTVAGVSSREGPAMFMLEVSRAFPETERTLCKGTYSPPARVVKVFSRFSKKRLTPGRGSRYGFNITSVRFVVKSPAAPSPWRNPHDAPPIPYGLPCPAWPAPPSWSSPWAARPGPRRLRPRPRAPHSLADPGGGGQGREARRGCHRHRAPAGREHPGRAPGRRSR